MEENKELKLIVKTNTYKEIANYLHNELKITRLEIEKIIENYIERRFLDSEWMEYINNDIYKVVEKSIARLSSQRIWDIDNSIDAAIEKCLGQYIMKKINDKLIKSDFLILETQ
jgi:hypothetical protein